MENQINKNSFYWGFVAGLAVTLIIILICMIIRMQL